MVEIKSSDDLKSWLNARPEKTRRADAVLIASRSALRVVPLLARLLDKHAKERRKSIVLPVFRILAITQFSGIWPKRVTLLEGVDAKSIGASVAAYATHAAYAATPTDIAAVRAAANAAAVASVNYAAATYAAANTAEAAAAAAQDTYTTQQGEDAVRAIYWAIEEDARALEAGRNHPEVSAISLWHEKPAVWAVTYWKNLYNHLSFTAPAEEGWQVWLEWYEERLLGSWMKAHSRVLELAICQIPDEMWKAGPAEVNARIAELIEEHLPQKVEPDASSEEQTTTCVFSLERTSEQTETDFEVDATSQRISAVSPAEDRPSIDDPFRKNDLGSKLLGLKDFARELHTDIKEDHPRAPGPLRRDFDRYAREAGKSPVDVSIKVLHRRAVRFEGAMQEEEIKKALGNYVLSKFQDFLADHHALMAEHFTNVLEVMKRNDAVPIPNTTTLVHFEQGFETAAELLSGPAWIGMPTPPEEFPDLFREQLADLRAAREALEAKPLDDVRRAGQRRLAQDNRVLLATAGQMIGRGVEHVANNREIRATANLGSSISFLDWLVEMLWVNG